MNYVINLLGLILVGLGDYFGESIPNQEMGLHQRSILNEYLDNPIFSREERR